MTVMELIMKLPKIGDYIVTDDLNEVERNLILLMLLNRRSCYWFDISDYIVRCERDKTTITLDDASLSRLSKYVYLSKWIRIHDVDNFIEEYDRCEGDSVLYEDEYDIEGGVVYFEGNELLYDYCVGYDITLLPDYSQYYDTYMRDLDNYIDAVFNDAIYVYLNTSDELIAEFKETYKDLYNSQDSLKSKINIATIDSLLSGDMEGLHLLFK